MYKCTWSTRFSLLNYFGVKAWIADNEQLVDGLSITCNKFYEENFTTFSTEHTSKHSNFKTRGDRI